MVTYTTSGGKSYFFKLSASRAIELEGRLGASVPKKVTELDRLSVSSEFIAAALDLHGADYSERKLIALEIFDDMADNGKSLTDYELLIYEILVSAGFMKSEGLTLRKRLAEKQEATLAEAMKKLHGDEAAPSC